MSHWSSHIHYAKDASSEDSTQKKSSASWEWEEEQGREKLRLSILGVFGAQSKLEAVFFLSQLQALQAGVCNAGTHCQLLT